MTRAYTKWVPRLLTANEMERRVNDSQEFLRRCRRNKNFLNNVITMDETWLHYYEPQSKRQPSVWKPRKTPPPKNAKAAKSIGKVMIMVFMDNKGVLLARHAVSPGQTINAVYYSNVQ